MKRHINEKLYFCFKLTEYLNCIHSEMISRNFSVKLIQTSFLNFQGNKKGPIGRWDFDTAEEYADYMSSKEALPKAAFQYGVKMNEGRKTRGKVGAKTDKAKLDKEWNKISAIIDKRKTSGGGGGSMPKMPKYD